MLTVADTRWTPDTIKALRKRLRLRQDEFALLLGYGERRQSVSDLETGKTSPTGTVNVLLDIIDAHDGLPSRDATP
jgi:DNA-binding transcriptional regulator YiaG